MRATIEAQTEEVARIAENEAALRAFYGKSFEFAQERLRAAVKTLQWCADNKDELHEFRRTRKKGGAAE